jgi:hypothetical protein
VIHDAIAVEDSPKPRPDDSISSGRVGDEEGNDSTESFSATEAGGDDAEIGVWTVGGR